MSTPDFTPEAAPVATPDQPALKPTMNPIHKIWRWFITPHTLAEWKWEGNKLTDLPRAAWCDFRRAIRGPIIQFLAGNDLVVIGDIWCSTTSGSGLIQVEGNRDALIIGSIGTHDGPTAIVPRGCKPPAPKPLQALIVTGWSCSAWPGSPRPGRKAMTNKQLYFLCGVILFSVANIFRPALLAVFAAVLFVWAGWGEK
jgi:hypothetical protein